MSERDGRDLTSPNGRQVPDSLRRRSSAGCPCASGQPDLAHRLGDLRLYLTLLVDRRDRDEGRPFPPAALACALAGRLTGDDLRTLGRRIAALTVITMDFG